MKDTRHEVLHFWFEETEPRQWFQKNRDFDALIKERFAVTYDMAAKGLCDHWMDNADGSLALCIVLDQFPRNMFRDTPKAFATDEKALGVSRHALSKGFDQILRPMKRRFLYLPFEHSEEIQDQKHAVFLFEKMKKEDPMGYDYALKHLEVIEKFGRFPHRNHILGRKNTDEEEAYLAQANTGF